MWYEFLKGLLLVGVVAYVLIWLDMGLFGDDGDLDDEQDN